MFVCVVCGLLVEAIVGCPSMVLWFAVLLHFYTNSVLFLLLSELHKFHLILYVSRTLCCSIIIIQ